MDIRQLQEAIKAGPLAPLTPPHPGEILREEFLKPLGITPYRLAKELGVNRPWVNDIVLERRRISAKMAARLGRYFGTTVQFWMNLQQWHDLQMVLDDAEFMASLAAVKPLKREDL